MSAIDFDHNATTRPLPEVLEVVARCWRDAYANPGSRHPLGRAARRILEESRESLAEMLGAAPDELIFTSGGTESNNLAIRGLVRGRGGLIARAAGEHPSVLEACDALAERDFATWTIPVDAQGLMTAASLADAPWDRVRLATCLWAHNETGVIQDPAPLAALCAEHRVPLHLDGVQAVGKMPVDFHATRATSLSFAAHKFHGPRGVGGLLVRRGVPLQPLLFGGHQESGKRAGTEPVPLVAGMALALQLWRRDASSRQQRLAELRDRLEAGLTARCAPVVVHSQQAPRLPNTLNIAFPGVDGEALLVSLDLSGLCASLGSACASGSSEPTPALLAMGIPPDLAKSSIRFSLGIDNTEQDIDRALDIISSRVTTLRNLASPTA
jgi:cysteine desulfurase